MPERVIVEIFIIGNEILNGDIQDTNSNWLCREVGGLGGYVSRATVLRDDPEVIAAEIRAALDRGPEVIFTSGGLGPTADDLTLTAIAKGVGVGVRPDEDAMKMVKDSYDDFFARGILDQGGLNPAREKMAWLPEGAVPLLNPVGTAPGVLLKAGRTTIISLPGVPSELKGICSSSLKPFCRETFSGGTAIMHSITVHCNDESILEPVLSRVVPAHPEVYIKSLARTLGEIPELDITLTVAGTDRAAMEMILGAALRDLRQGLESIGIRYWDKVRK